LLEVDQFSSIFLFLSVRRLALFVDHLDHVLFVKNSHIYQERVRIGRSFTQMICWCTNAPCLFQVASTMAWFRLACQQYHAASGAMAAFGAVKRR
jgi:hypothetical protein